MQRTWSIQTGLALLAVTVIVPLVGVDAYAIWNEARTSARRAERSAQSLAEAASVNVTQLLQDADTVLLSLARWAAETRPDNPTCTRHLEQARAVLPEFYNLTLMDVRGTVTCTSIPAESDTMPTAEDREWFRTVTETRRFTVSKPVVGKVSGLWITVFARPVLSEDGELLGAVLASMDLTRFERLFREVSLPEGGVLTLAHADGTVVARSRDGEEWVGRRLPGSQEPDTARGSLSAEKLMAAPGINRATGAGGAEQIFAWAPIPEAEWVLFAGLPVEWVYGPVRSQAIQGALILITVLLITLIAIRWLYGSISSSIVTLVDDTRAAAREEEGKVRIQGPREVQELARQFNTTLEAREEAEEELRAAEERMRQRQRLEAVGRLAGGIAHDFNNLLTVIRGHTNLLERELPQEGEVGQGLQEIDRASQRAADLVQQLLAFSRRESLDMEPVDLNRRLRELRKVLSSMLGETVELELDLGGDVGPVKANPGRLEQIVLNLVMNAQDAMPEGGRLTIRTRAVGVGPEDDAARGGDVPPGRYVTMEVSDTGRGMDESVRRRIFEPFFTTKPREDGTGLGLSAVYGEITRLGGHVTVASDPGEGATFTLYVPADGEGGR